MERERIIRITVLVLIIVAFVSIFASGILFPPQNETGEPKELSVVTGGIQAELDGIAAVVDKASKELSTGVEGESAQVVLDDAYESTPDAVYFCTITPEGLVGEFSPDSYNISPDQTANINLPGNLEEKGRTMGNVSQYGENYAFEILQAVYDDEGNFIGAVAAVVRPVQFLQEIVTPVEEMSDSTFTVMQTDGLILYDSGIEQIGKNLFTDEMFSAFPNLRNLGVKIVAKSEGYGSYMYYPAGENEGRPVKKLAYWDSAGLFGTEWRVIMFKEVLS